MKDELLFLIRLEIGDAHPSEVVSWAMEKVSNNIVTDSILEMAWLNDASMSVVMPLYKKALSEIGVAVPGDDALSLAKAKYIAKCMVDGKIDLNVGCSKIAEISVELDTPEELSIFNMLAHEQTGHEMLGITSENIKNEILEEAKKIAFVT